MAQAAAAAVSVRAPNEIVQGPMRCTQCKVRYPDADAWKRHRINLEEDGTTQCQRNRHQLDALTAVREGRRA